MKAPCVFGIHIPSTVASNRTKEGVVTQTLSCRCGRVRLFRTVHVHSVRNKLGIKVGEHQVWFPEVKLVSKGFRHTCHWPGCEETVNPSLWGCKTHWYKLPRRLRDKIWLHYRPGQEVTKTPSIEYVAAAKEVQEFIKEYETIHSTKYT